MISVKSNTSAVLTRILTKVRSTVNNDVLLRTLATDQRADMKVRIHVDGLDADDKQIGNYSAGYMKVRTGKVKLKSNNKKGFNRTGDTKVVASLTRVMENDLVVVPTANGYGIGYNNSENYKKAGYVEATYKKRIFKVSVAERQRRIETAIEITNKTLNA